MRAIWVHEKNGACTLGKCFIATYANNTDVRLPFLQALGDLALRKGIKQLDRYLRSSPATEEANPALDPELSQQPLLDVFLGMLQRWENCLERLGKGKRTKAGQAGTSYYEILGMVVLLPLQPLAQPGG